MLGIETISPSFECHFRHHYGPPSVAGSPLRARHTLMYKKQSCPRGFTVRRVVENGHIYKLPSLSVWSTTVGAQGVCVCACEHKGGSNSE